MSKLAAADLHWLEEDHFFLALVNTTIMVGGSGGGGSHTKSYTSNGSCYNLSLTVQVIRQHGQLALSELTHGVGLMAGSTSIDDRFQQYVRDLFGPAADHLDCFGSLCCLLGDMTAMTTSAGLL